MGEPRRVDVKHIGPAISKKKEKKHEPSYRFEIKLRESTTDYFPEISFAELIEDRKKSEAPPDPDAVDMKEVEEIAKRMEEKYGGGSRKKRQADDFYDLGEGYDDNDPFIDNAEAYDELVPSFLTTELGGFYINRGSLDFKEVLSSSAIDRTGDDSSSEFQSKPKRRRRIKFVHSASEDDEMRVKRKKKRKVQFFGEDAGAIVRLKKKRMSGHVPAVLGRPKKNKTKNLIVGQTERTQRTEVMSEHVARKYDSIIDDVINQCMQGESSSDELVVEEQQAVPTAADSAAVNDHQASASTTAVPASSSAMSELGATKEFPKLPQCLPEQVISQIEDLKRAAENSSDGKQKFFSASVNRMLLRLALDTRQLNGPQRRAISTYLACYLPVGRETLMKRMKQLLLKEEDAILRDPLHKLKQAVELAMAPLMEKYNLDIAVAANTRLENREVDAAVAERIKDEIVLSDDDDRPVDALQLAENGIERKGLNVAVRKRFPWTDDLRLLLCTVVQLKMESFLATKTKGQQAEDFLKEFLELHVKNFWPKGWMQTRILYKESRAAHSGWTSLSLSKLKKLGPLNISKGFESSSVQQQRRSEPEKALSSAYIPVASGTSAPDAARVVDDVDDVEDSESSNDCSSSDDLPLKDLKSDRSAATVATCSGAPLAALNTNNSNANITNGCKKPESLVQDELTSGLDVKIHRPDTPSKVATNAIAHSTTVGSFSANSTSGATASCTAPSHPPAATNSISSSSNAVVFPALTAAVSHANVVDRLGPGAVASAVSANKLASSFAPRHQGHLTVSAVRHQSGASVVSILHPNKGTAAASTPTSTVSRAAVASPHLPRLTSVSLASSPSVTKVMLATRMPSQGGYRSTAEVPVLPQHRGTTDVGRGTTMLTIRAHQPGESPVPRAAVATDGAYHREVSPMPRGRPPSVNRLPASSATATMTIQKTAGSSAQSHSIGTVRFQNPGNPALPSSSGGSTFVNSESRASPQITGSTPESVQRRPCALDSPASNTVGMSASASKTAHWSTAKPGATLVAQQNVRQIVQQQLQQQNSLTPQPQQQSRMVQHRIPTPEQLALHEVQRQQQGRLTVDQIFSMPTTSAQYSAACSNAGTVGGSLALNSPVHVHGNSSGVQSSNKLHQPWAMGVRASLHTASPSEQLTQQAQQQSLRAGRSDAIRATVGILPPSPGSRSQQLPSDRLTPTICRPLPALSDLPQPQGCTPTSQPISRSPLPTHRTAAVATSAASGGSIITGQSGSSFAALDQAYLNSVPKKS